MKVSKVIDLQLAKRKSNLRITTTKKWNDTDPTECVRPGLQKGTVKITVESYIGEVV